MEPVLYTQYKEKIVPALKEHFGFTNVMQVPKIEKIVVNVGYGRNHKNKGFIDNAEKTLIAPETTFQDGDYALQTLYERFE